MAKGGRENTDRTMPAFFETGLQQAIGMSQDLAARPYAEYRGPDVAAFSPMQDAAFQNTQDAAAAFGLGTGAGNYMPTPVQDGGAMGYSSATIYDAATATLVEDSPATADILVVLE